MQMRTNSGVRLGWAKIAATLAIAAAVFSTTAPVVHAQTSSNSTIGAIRLGAYIPVNSNTQSAYGRYYFAGGLDYVFQNEGISQRDIVSVDYTQASHNGNTLSVIPVTIGQQSIEQAHGQGVRPYFSYGIGAYFVHIKNPNFSGNDTVNGTAFGGYLGAGLDLTSNIFVDARYHIVTPVKAVDADALELTAGVRF